LCRNHESIRLSLAPQAFFGGSAAAGFGVLFNCPPRLLWLCFASGALALAVRTGGQDIGGLGLPEASFIAAFLIAVLNRMLEPPDSPRGSVLAVVGCIPMIPGSLAAKGLMNLFELLRATPGAGLLSTTAAVENLMIVALTLVGIGTALAIPTLVFPVRQSDD
jgi:uncharacterized membrane protein YjjB (DUF3815 family)